MIQINFDIPMPESCISCPLYDDEFDYCHGHIGDNLAWELADYRYEGKPNWCPLIEVNNDS